MVDPQQSELFANADKRQKEYSKDASTVARPLILSGFALVWLFQPDTKEQPAHLGLTGIGRSDQLVAVLACFVAFILIDLLQYAIAASLWALFAWTVYEQAGIRSSGHPKRQAVAAKLGTLFQLQFLATDKQVTQKGQDVLSTGGSPRYVNGISRLLFLAKMAVGLGGYIVFLFYLL